MVLRMDDIAVFIANWENKADNIRQIQSILNIGFDSMVFLDDNPFERNFVKESIPGIVLYPIFRKILLITLNISIH
jgi:predicted enzyme involved in methoxymalonyl-ACP biosynthesis